SHQQYFLFISIGLMVRYKFWILVLTV
ncbi:unnamed protein product, partial [Rotaria magnacalcarata]